MAHQGLHLTASRDSEAANVARCSAGDSWSKRDWWLYQCRAGTICNRTIVGSCTIFTNLSRPTRAPPSAPAASDTGTAVVPPDAFGDDCTYVDSSSVEGSLSEQRSSYTVPAHSADGCCKACVADLTCGGAMYSPGSEPQDNVTCMQNEQWHRVPLPPPLSLTLAGHRAPTFLGLRLRSFCPSWLGASGVAAAP